MFKLIGLGLGALALLATSLAANAADMPVKAPYYKGPTKAYHHFNWTGAYAGLFGGYGWGSSTWDAAGGAGSIVNKPRGTMFGATLGYNWHAGGSFVYGIEGDIGWSSMKSSTPCGPASIFSCESRNQFLGTVRGRAGMAFDNVMPYMTAGVAIGDIKAATSSILFPGANGTKVGWTVGAGLEYAFLQNWTAKVEYLYFNLGSIDCGLSCSLAVTPNRVSLTGNRFTVGLNYKFSTKHYDKY